MRCIKPFVTAKAAFGCGQCMPCRFNRQRLWMHRILLEGQVCEDKGGSCFTTLTYSPEKEPSNRSVDRRELQLWIKRVRKALPERKLRYYGVGEYGDRSGRPHYHCVLFGAKCDKGPIEQLEGRYVCKCMICSVVRRTWPFGHVVVAPLTDERAKYIARYTLKRMTSVSDERLCGREPEFALMSRKPGIGAGAMEFVGSDVLQLSIDTPWSLYHGKLVLPLGRYLRKRLEDRVGADSGEDYVDKELQEVREYAFKVGKSVESVYRELYTPFAERLQAKARRLNREAL